MKGARRFKWFLTALGVGLTLECQNLALQYTLCRHKRGLRTVLSTELLVAAEIPWIVSVAVPNIEGIERVEWSLLSPSLPGSQPTSGRWSYQGKYKAAASEPRKRPLEPLRLPICCTKSFWIA